MKNLGHEISRAFAMRSLLAAGLACLLLEASAFAADPVEVLFVKNGYYQQETDILNHLNALGCYQVTTLKDSQVTGSTDLGVYDLIIITEFAPNISSYGINNIKNSGKPVMIVEYWDFWYSYKLGLVEDDWAGYYGTATVDVTDAEHPITYLFNDTITVYNPSYTVYGIPMEDIKDGVTPLIYSSESFNEVAVISDDTRKYVATGIYDTRKFTFDGWRIFDMILTYLHKPGPEWNNMDEALAGSGVAALLSEISQNPEEWTYDQAAMEIWLRLVANGITHVWLDLTQILVELFNPGSIIILPKQYGIENHIMYQQAIPGELFWGDCKEGDIVFIPGTGNRLCSLTGPDSVPLAKLRATIYYETGRQPECREFYDTITNMGNGILPEKMEYLSTEANGVPLLRFQAKDDHSQDMLRYPPGAGAEDLNFAITLIKKQEYDLSAPNNEKEETGSTPVLDRDRLYPGLDLVHPESYKLYYWWGRKLVPGGVWSLTKEALDFTRKDKRSGQDPYETQLKGMLDVFLFDSGRFESKRRDNWKCLVRFHELYLYETGSMGPSTYEENPIPGGIPTADKWNFLQVCQDGCDYPREFMPYLPNNMPNSFADAAGWSLSDEILVSGLPLGTQVPRMQLASPTNRNLNYQNPIEYYCNRPTNPCDGIALDIYDYDPDMYVEPDPVQSDIFKENFGISGDYNPKEHLSRRNRPDAWWFDQGPWQVPHLTAGMETKLVVVIRDFIWALDAQSFSYINETSENPNLGTWYGSTYCDLQQSIGQSDGYPSIAYLAYKTEDGLPTENWNFTSEVTMPCYSSPLWPFYTFSAGTYDDIDGFKEKTLAIPANARGLAYIVWDGCLIFDDLLNPVTSCQQRLFPVFVEPINDGAGGEPSEETALLPSNDAIPAGWLGAPTRTYLINDPVPATSIVDTIMKPWLIGGDTGLWVEKDGDLYALFGDLVMNWATGGVNYDQNDLDFMFDIINYYGSNAAFKLDRNVGDEGFILGYHDLQIDRQTYFPSMNPVYAKKLDVIPWWDMYKNNHFWEMIRRDGNSLDLGQYHQGRIEKCQKSHIQTVAAKGAFQFPSDYRENKNGKVYLWYRVVPDWGVRAGDFSKSTYAANYNPRLWSEGFDESINDQTPMYSFIAVWNQVGVDDMAQSVKWDGVMKADGTLADCGANPQYCWTLFVEPAILVVGTGSSVNLRLDEAICGSPVPGDCFIKGENEGILVWHPGRYRADGVYFSFAKKEDVLIRENYYHFAGIDGTGNPIWQQTNETASKYVLTDHIGEISVVYNTSRTNHWQVFFNVNNGGQSGIVIREAATPWGPFGKQIPMVDCLEMHRRYQDKNIYDQWEGKGLFLEGGFCYGGWTNVNLFEEDDENMVIRLNASLWQPYKQVIMETLLKKQEPQ